MLYRLRVIGIKLCHEEKQLRTKFNQNKRLKYEGHPESTILFIKEGHVSEYSILSLHHAHCIEMEMKWRIENPKDDGFTLFER